MTFKLSDLSVCTVQVQLIRHAAGRRYEVLIRNTHDVDELVGAELRRQDREHFLVIYLDRSNCVIDVERVATGTLSEVTLSPREVFKGAMLANAASVIFVHNHPSGQVWPSFEDVTTTEVLVQAGKLLGIGVQDHVIIGATCWYSFRQQGKMPS